MKCSILSLFLLLITISCSGNLQKDEFSLDNLHSYAQSEFPDGYYLIFNSDTSYAVCTNKKLSQLPGSFRFLIYNLSESMNIFSDVVTRGKLEWISKYEIKVYEEPGIIKGDENTDHEYIYNVLRNKKTKSSSESLSE